MQKRLFIPTLLVVLSLSLSCASQAAPGSTALEDREVIAPTPAARIATVEELARASIESAQLSLTVTGIFGSILSIILVLVSLLGFKNLTDVKKNQKETEKKFTSATDLSEALITAQAALAEGSLKIDCGQAIRELESIEADYSTHRTLHIYLGRLYRRLGDYDCAIRALRDFINNLECDPKLRNSPEAKIDIADANYNIACYHALKAKEEAAGRNRALEIDRLVGETILFLRNAIDGNSQNKQGAWNDPDFEFEPVRKRIQEEFGEQAGED